MIGSHQQFRQPACSHLYHCYGLRIGADRALPELPDLPSNDRHCDVTIGEGSTGVPMVDGDQIAYRPVSLDEVVVQWPSVGALRVSGGRHITYEMGDGVDPLVFRMFIFCQGLGVVLQQRKFLVLHASCVSFGDQTVAFAGVSGAGKSTIAAACCELGAHLLADDVLAVSFDDGQPPRAWPGFARLKLRPEAAGQFAFTAGESAPAVGEFGKFLHRPTSGFGSAPACLDRIYVLANGDPLRVESLDSREAFQFLAQHTYGRALIPYLRLEAIHLAQCGSLIRSRIVRRLVRPMNLDFLSHAVEAIRGDRE
jgi:hypothetical protein